MQTRPATTTARPRSTFRLSAPRALALAALVSAAAGGVTARAQQDFIIDESRGNSPYTYSGGQTTYADLSVGYRSGGMGGTGVLTQTGGTLIADSFYVGSFSGANGIYNLSGASSMLQAGSVVIGDFGGNGTVNQSGGSLRAGTLQISNSFDSNANYNLSGGSITTTGEMTVGLGPTTFNHTGGSVNTNGQNFRLGVFSSGTITYNLSGANSVLSTGTATIGDTPNTFLGGTPTVTFNQNGGLFTTNGSGLFIGTGSLNGIFNLNAGRLVVGRVSGGGAEGGGTFYFNGGTLAPAASRSGFFESFDGGPANGQIAAKVRNGGAIIDTSGFNVDFAQGIVHAGLAGDNATDGGLTKNGAGTLLLLGTNTYTGNTTVNAGILQASGVASLPGYNAAGKVNVANGGTLAVSVGGNTPWTAVNLDTLRGAATFNAGSALGIDTTGATGGFAYNSGITGVLGLTKLGAGDLTLSLIAANTFTGDVRVQGGNLLLHKITGSGAGTAAFQGNLFVGNAVNPGSANTVTAALRADNQLRAGTNVTVYPDGLLDLQNHTTAIGALNVTASTVDPGNGGRLILNGNVTSVAAANPSTVGRTANAAGIVDLNGATRTFDVASGTGVSDLLVNSSLQNGGVTKTGLGNLTLAGNNTYAGNTLVSVGSLTLSGNVGVANSAADFTVNGPTGSGTSISLSGTLTSRTTRVGTDADGSFTQTSGTHTVLDMLYVGGTATGATASRGTYNLNSGALNTAVTQLGNAGAGTLNQSGGTHTVSSGLFVGLNNGTGTYNLTGGSLQTLNAVIGFTGTGTFNQTGGTHVVNDQLQLGNTVGSSGTYSLRNAGSTLTTVGQVSVGLNGTGVFTQDDGTTFSTGANSLVVGRNVGSNGTFILRGGVLSTGDTVVGGSGTGTFTQTGGVLTTNGNRLFVGQSSGSAGVYQFNGGDLTTAQVIGGGFVSNFNFNGGTLNVAASRTDFFQGLTTANVRNGGAFINTNDYNVTVAQALAHSNNSADNATDGGLTKQGAGVLTLTAANTYNGRTRVDGGTLLVNNATGSGTGPGPVSVSNAATLGGNGTIAGNVVVLSGGTLAPGASAGRLTLGGDLSLNGNGTLAIELGGATAGIGGYDQVRVGGSLTLGGNLTLSLLNGFTPTLGEKFFILDETGSATTVSGSFANATTGGLITDNLGNSYRLRYDDDTAGQPLGNDVSLTFLGPNPVPEPSTWALLAVGGALGCGAATTRRRRVQG